MRLNLSKCHNSHLSIAQRDCKKFDPVKRAKEIFTALDLNGVKSFLNCQIFFGSGDGAITEDEFVGGCKSDGSFLKVLLFQHSLIIGKPTFANSAFF